MAGSARGEAECAARAVDIRGRPKLRVVGCDSTTDQLTGKVAERFRRWENDVVRFAKKRLDRGGRSREDQPPRWCPQALRQRRQGRGSWTPRWFCGLLPSAEGNRIRVSHTPCPRPIPICSLKPSARWRTPTNM